MTIAVQYPARIPPPSPATNTSGIPGFVSADVADDFAGAGAFSLSHRSSAPRAVNEWQRMRSAISAPASPAHVVRSMLSDARMVLTS